MAPGSACLRARGFILYGAEVKPLKDSSIASSWESYRSYIARRQSGIYTGISSLDEYLLGLGGTVSVQGETSVNKSTLALQICHHNAKRGNPVIIIDKENGLGVLMSRLLCQSAEKSETMLRDLGAKDRIAVAARLDALPIYIYTESVKDQEDIVDRIKEAYEVHKKPVILLVDSVQALDAAATDPRVSLETWLYFFDRLKVEMDGKLTVIMVSEKNRMSYGGAGIGGGKGSNVLDYKPETILDIRWHDSEDVYVVKVLKHRHGLRGGEFDLRKKLVDPQNNRSFCFLLEEIGNDPT